MTEETMGKELSLRAMIFPEGAEWVAHCLDLDIVSTGPTSQVAIDALVEAVSTQLGDARKHDNFEFLFRPAPPEAWQRFGKMLKGPHRILVRSVDNGDTDTDFELQLLAA